MVSARNMQDEKYQRRVMLWTHPRAMSTAFFRAMNSPSYTKGLFERYTVAYRFGLKTNSQQFLHEESMEHFTFSAMKQELEKDYDEFQVVFAKDMAFALTDNMAYFSRNYRHTFLIRDPQKAVPSYFLGMCKRSNHTGYSKYHSIGMDKLYAIFQKVTDDFEQPPIVIDADDILQDPEAMLKEYCKRSGIPFDDSMLHWTKLSEQDIQTIFRPWSDGVIKEFFQSAIDQKCFNKDIRGKKQPIDLSEEAKADLEESMIYYNKLAVHKIQIIE